MKLNHIYDIATTTSEFMYKVINLDEALDYEVLMERLDNISHQATEHTDDTIDIDYKDMCFTVQLDTVLGQWVLCKNASYYVLKNGFLDAEDGIIDVELN